MLVTKPEILKLVEAQYAQLVNMIQSVRSKPEGKGDRIVGDWTAKDLLAHVAAWEKVLLEFHIGGQPFEEVIAMPGARYHYTSFDEINAHLLDTYRSWSWEQVQEFSTQIHRDLVQKLEQLPEQAYQEPAGSIAAIGLDPYPLHEYIAANTYDHYSEHLESFAKSD
jgi:hypothetical protein